MGFIDKLRMNSIYGGRLIGKDIRPIRYEEYEDDSREQNLRLAIIGEQLKAAQMQNMNANLDMVRPKKMDVVYQPPISERINATANKPISDFQRESLNLRRRSIDVS